MSFIPGYEHDVFISYAHVDDRPFIASAGLESSPGWVSTLVHHLKNEIAQKIGRSDTVSVWFDSHNLRGNHQLTDEIAARLERVAIFVAVLSPGYVASQWCQDEARLFARCCSGDPGRRLFVIEKSPLDGELRAPGLRRPSRLSLLVQRSRRAAAHVCNPTASPRRDRLFPTDRGRRPRYSRLVQSDAR